MSDQSDQEILKKLKEQETKASKSKKILPKGKTDFPLGLETQKPD
jgi:hypothetical protein